MASPLPPWLHVAWAAAGILVALGGFLWVIFVLYPYLRWTKSMMQRSFDLGFQTSQHLDTLQKELTPVIGDLKKAVSDARAIITELREKELDKMVKVLDRVAAEMEKIGENGTVQEVLSAIKAIPAKLDAITSEGKKGLIGRL